jgi:glycosyltransferase involved in cell wall biosynthesis
MSFVTIVVPCFNEAGRLRSSEYRRFLAAAPVHLLFVNDGSTDRTLPVLEALRDQFPEKVSVLDLAKNGGKANAVRLGILQAVGAGTVGFVGFMDADLSTPLEETRYFLRTFQQPEIEFVFGSRISRIGAQIQRFRYRHYFGRVVASAISIYLGLPVYDSQCGAKFFRPGLAKMVFNEPFVSKWLFDIEIFRRIERSGRIVDRCSIELPLHSWIEKGKSKLGIKDLLRLPVEFSRIIYAYRSVPRQRALALEVFEATHTVPAKSAV